MKLNVTDTLLNLKPYVPGKPIDLVQREYGLDSVVKLASNENPLGPSPKAMEAIVKAIPDIHRYPDASCYHLTKKFSRVLGVEEKRLVFGNGSNELIDLLIKIFCEPEDKILTSELSFVAYYVCAGANRARALVTPMGDDFKFSVKNIVQQIEQHGDALKIVFVANPNNPTGTYLNNSEALEILEAASQFENLWVVFDEAYNEFVRANDFPNTLSLQNKFPRLILLRTMGKVYGLAGLRVGYMVADSQLVELVHRVRNPFNVNSLAQVAAAAAIEDIEFIKKSQETVWQGLDYFYGELRRLKIKYWESQANFVFFDCGQAAQPLNEKLLQRGVILRPIQNKSQSPYLRMSVGTQAENERAIDTLSQVL